MWDYFFQCKMGELRNWPQVWIIRLSQLKAIMSVVLETANSLAWCNTTAQQCSKSPNHSNNNIDNNNKTSRPVHHVHMYFKWKVIQCGYSNWYSVFRESTRLPFECAQLEWELIFGGPQRFWHACEVKQNPWNSRLSLLLLPLSSLPLPLP